MRRFLLSTVPASLPSADVASRWRALGDTEAPRELCRRRDAVLFADAAPATSFAEDGRGFCFLPARDPVAWRHGRVVPATDLLAAVRRDGAAAFAELTPPFAAVVQIAPDAPVLVATDAAGLQHVHACRHGGGVLVADSALLLAALTDAELDPEAVLTFLRIGHYLGADSPFRGVEKLRGGEFWQLTGSTRNAVPLPPVAVPALDGAACVRACVAAQLAAQPDALVELSGGLDSRLIVAALGRDACRGRPAVTLGTADAADVQVGERIARELGFAWQFVDLGGLADLGDDEVLPLVRAASQRCDHTTQPLARAVLEWVNARVPRLPRFSGQNGELARGFYHPGFPARAPVSEALTARLLRWRLCTNDSIDEALVDPGLWRAHEARLQQRVFAALRDAGGAWAPATDTFYLRERMQRWVGAAYSAETQDHAVRAPFFDPRFVAWAQRLPAAQKRDSRAMARACAELDGWLGRLPTAGGPSPAVLGSNGPWAHAVRRARFLAKVARKVSQKLVGTRRSPVGAPAFARRLLGNGIDRPESFPHVARLDWLRADAIGGVLGRGVASWASLGHLLALEWTLATLAAARSAR